MNKKLNEIVELNQTERHALLESVKDLSQEQLNFKPSAEDWSVGEILKHLSVLEGRVTMLLGKKLQEATAAGIGPDPDEVSVLNCLDQFPISEPTIKVKAPPQVAPEHGVDKQVLLDGLAESRTMLLNAVQAISDVDLNKLTFMHPFFGEWNMYQWTLAIGKHEHRHAIQIANVKLADGYPISSSATNA
jgi:hypothetical protein